MSSCIHIGPYAKCPIQRVQKIDIVPGCSICRLPIIEKFCGRCGALKSTYEVAITAKEADWVDIINKTDERLYWINDPYGIDKSKFDIYAPNIGTVNLKHSFNPLDHESTARKLLSINAEMIQNELNNFQHDFQEEILVLERAYGSVEIFWGFISHYS